MYIYIYICIHPLPGHFRALWRLPKQVLSLVARYARAFGAGSLFLQLLDPGLKEDPPQPGCNRYLGEGSLGQLRLMGDGGGEGLEVDA